MAVNKWLNIIVDGNSALSPYWPKIVSDYLEKIIRTFFDNSREEEANRAKCEVGLVMYNANSDLGLDVQYINWTKDIDFFLGLLSSLAFNGDNQNQHTMAEGLAEALMLFPRPSSKMTTEEYYDGERHCILIAARDPVPKRMLVSVPKIEGRFIGTQLHTLNADFCEVAEMFGPLAVSLSIISPMRHPIFQEIFNIAKENNDSTLTNNQISNYGGCEFTVLLSRNFKEAHVAFRGKKIMDPPIKESVESIKMPCDMRHSIDFVNDHQDLFPFSNMVTGEQIIEVAKDDRLESIDALPLFVPNASTNDVGIPILPMVASTTPTSVAVEGTSKGLFQGGSSGSCSMSTGVGVGIANQRDVPPDENPLLPHSIMNTFNFQPSSSPSMLPYYGSGSTPPNLPFQMTGFGPLGRLAFGPSPGAPHAPVTPQFNPCDFWPPPPSLTDFSDYVHEWEGSLVGNIHKRRPFVHWIKAFRKATSPSTLTIEWSSRLEIALYLPQKALDHTTKICRGPIDYVFLHLKQFQNIDLYNHLKNKNLCAKIHLPFHVLMIAPTESKHHYIGTAFPEDTVFIEPA